MWGCISLSVPLIKVMDGALPRGGWVYFLIFLRHFFGNGLTRWFTSLSQRKGKSSLQLHLKSCSIPHCRHFWGHSPCLFTANRRWWARVGFTLPLPASGAVCLLLVPLCTPPAVHVETLCIFASPWGKSRLCKQQGEWSGIHPDSICSK